MAPASQQAHLTRASASRAMIHRTIKTLVSISRRVCSAQFWNPPVLPIPLSFKLLQSQAFTPPLSLFSLLPHQADSPLKSTGSLKGLCRAQLDKMLKAALSDLMTLLQNLNSWRLRTVSLRRIWNPQSPPLAAWSSHWSGVMSQRMACQWPAELEATTPKPAQLLLPTPMPSLSPRAWPLGWVYKLPNSYEQTHSFAEWTSCQNHWWLKVQLLSLCLLERSICWEICNWWVLALTYRHVSCYCWAPSLHSSRLQIRHFVHTTPQRSDCSISDCNEASAKVMHGFSEFLAHWTCHSFTGLVWSAASGRDIQYPELIPMGNDSDQDWDRDSHKHCTCIGALPSHVQMTLWDCTLPLTCPRQVVLKAFEMEPLTIWVLTPLCWHISSWKCPFREGSSSIARSLPERHANDWSRDLPLSSLACQFALMSSNSLLFTEGTGTGLRQ